MAHFSEINEANIVLRIVVVDDQHEEDGVNWCHNFFGGTWVQTSYNNNIRFNYAGKGYSYDSDLDAFIPPKPFASWILDESVCHWVAPIEHPGEIGWVWDEDNEEWVEDDNPKD